MPQNNKLLHVLLSKMRYRYAATSVEGFVQQIACCYLRHGYWFYVRGQIPEGKTAEQVDEKLLSKYGIAISDTSRKRRKQKGTASLQYLRYQREFIILATHGEHRYFEEEAVSIRDVRRVPIRFCGYAISYRPGGRTRSGDPDSAWHAHVAIDHGQYRELKRRFLGLATKRSAEDLALKFYHLPYEPYSNSLKLVSHELGGFAKLCISRILNKEVHECQVKRRKFKSASGSKRSCRS